MDGTLGPNPRPYRARNGNKEATTKLKRLLADAMLTMRH